MSTSPERCLGNLLKDLNEEVSPDDFYSISKGLPSKNISEQSEQKLSLDTFYSFKSGSTLTSSGSNFINKKSILIAFNNQHDTIILQKMLMEASEENLDLIIKEMAGTFSLIIKNKNGNYFCSDLFKSCNEKQRIKILQEISVTLSEDCLDEYGTHSIQTLIENSSCEEEYKLIIASFNDCAKISKASKNSNGFFVIQKIINYIPEINRMEFNCLFLKLFYELSLDIYGISTVKAFTFKTKDEQILDDIWTITYNNFLSISKNQYGNYLIQSMIDHWGNSKLGTKLKKLIINNFNVLMENHFSKYICDLFINRSNIEEKKIILAILLKNKHNLNIFNNNKKNHDTINNKFDNSNNNKKNHDAINNKFDNINTIKKKHDSINNKFSNIINNKFNNNNNNINNKTVINIYSPLQNNAKPFYPKSKRKNTDK